MTTEIKPAVWNLKIYRGDTFDIKMYLKDNADNPIDLTGATVTAEIRAAEDSMSASTTFATIAQQADGFLHIQLDETASTNAVSGLWDLQIENGGVTRTYLRGSVTVTKDITR